MKKTLLLFAILFSSFSLFAQTYITNVTVGDVKKQKLKTNQTVVIEGDLITEIKSSKKVKIPSGATVIDGAGKFLFPGMTDAHIHFFQSGGLYTRPDVMDLRKEYSYDKEIENAHETMGSTLERYLKTGITNVIDVGATYNFLEKRAPYKNTPKYSSFSMTGPLLTTYMPEPYKGLKKNSPFSLVKTVEDGINMVKEQLAYKPDFIKIWYIVGADGLSFEKSARKSQPIIKAIIDEAHKNNLKVAVHATERITAQLAVESGADFLVHSVDDEVVTKDFAKLLAKNKTILSPTLIVSKDYDVALGQRLAFSNYELRTADPYQIGTLSDLKHIENNRIVDSYKAYFNNPSTISKEKKKYKTMLDNLKILSDAGVLIATGTDAGNIGTMHASSYLAEVKAMSESGMSNWQIMTASTINGAKILSQEKEFGSIEVGKKANLILLDKNPIDDIENITKIHRVINLGKVYDPSKTLPDSPEDLAQRQLNAYNERNIDAFLEPYAEDVEVYSHPSRLLFKGKETMRKSYAQMFKNTPNLHCELKNRIVQGNVVIDQELVTFGSEKSKAIAIYHIKDGKIQKVFFIQ
ncbi:MAG: amidohydrolase family protein [Flavobacteriaceae bacterium]